MDTFVENLASWLVILVVTASIVGLLVLLSNKLRSRPLVGTLIVPVANGVLFGLCNPLILLSSMALLMILEGDFSHLLLTLRNELLSFSLRGLLSFFTFLGAPAAILGALVGLMAYMGTFLWRGTKHSRLRTVGGFFLLVLAWLVLGLGLTVEILFLAAISS